MGDFPHKIIKTCDIYGGFFPSTLGGNFITNNLFFTDKDKTNIGVGFSKKSFTSHKGVSGLKYYLIVMYLRKHMDIFGEISFTLNKLLDECGYLTKTHNNSIYSDFRKIIQHDIIEKGFAISSFDIMTINPSSLYTLQLLPDQSLFFTSDNFVTLTIREYETIAKSNIGKVNKSILVGVYLFIKQYILSDSLMNDHFIKIAYPSKQQIKKGVGISSLTTIESAISILNSLKLIFIKSDMFIEDYEEKGAYIPTRNVYALKEDELKSDAIKLELENIYKRTVYTENEVPGKIKYLNKKKG